MQRREIRPRKAREGERERRRAQEDVVASAVEKPVDVGRKGKEGGGRKQLPHGQLGLRSPFAYASRG